MISPAFRVLTTSASSLQLDLVLHGPQDVNDDASGSVPDADSGPAVRAPFDSRRASSVAQYRANCAALQTVFSLMRGSSVFCADFDALNRVAALAVDALHDDVALKTECGYLPCLFV